MRPLNVFSATFSLTAVSQYPFVAGLFWALVCVGPLRLDPNYALGALGGMVAGIAFYRLRSNYPRAPPLRWVYSVAGSALTCVAVPMGLARLAPGDVQGAVGMAVNLGGSYFFMDWELFYANAVSYCTLYIAILLERYVFPQDTLRHALHHEAVVLMLGAALVMVLFQLR